MLSRLFLCDWEPKAEGSKVGVYSELDSMFQTSLDYIVRYVLEKTKQKSGTFFY